MRNDVPWGLVTWYAQTRTGAVRSYPGLVALLKNPAIASRLPHASLELLDTLTIPTQYSYDAMRYLGSR